MEQTFPSVWHAVSVQLPVFIAPPSSPAASGSQGSVLELTEAAVPSLFGDETRRRFAGGFSRCERDRGLGFVRYAGRFSNIRGMAPTRSLGFSRCRSTDCPLILNSSARIMSVVSKCFSHTRTAFDSKLKAPVSCRGMARFHLSRCSRSLGRQNSEAFSVQLR